jgi:hypothetical protein
MKLHRRVVLCVLSSMTLLSLTLRYPQTPHELGVDSFFIHNLATTIVADGRAEWILNPLSYFGWYPLSYPSAGPFLIAGFSDVGGLSVELSILLLSLAFGALGVPMTFAMAREFRDDDLFCLAVAFAYSFAPRYLAFTLWSASMRSLFMVLLPLFVWIVLRTHREPTLRNFGLVLVMFLMLAGIHRLAILMAIVIIAFVAATLVHVVLRTMRIRFPKVVLAAPYRRVSPYLALGAFAGTAGAMVFGTNVLSEYSTGELFSGTDPQIELLNFGVSLARSVGLSLVFAVLGIIVMVRLRNKTLREPFLLLAFLSLTPTLFLRVYTGFYILPFIAIFAGLAIVGFMRIQRPRIRATLVITFFAASLVFSTGVLDYEVNHTTVLPMTMYSTALYVKGYSGDPTAIANDGLVGIRVASVSGCSYLPVGGAGTTFQSPELLAYHYFTPGEVQSNLAWVPFQDLTLDSDSPWSVPSIQAEADWVAIMQSPFGAYGATIRRYHPTLFLENKYLPGSFFAFGNEYPSAFATTAYSGAYKIYDGDAEALWYVSAPQSP